MATLSKEEYLKRYLSSDATKDKKRKKKKVAPNAKPTNVRIIDDDIDLKSIKTSAEAARDSDDEAPTVAEVIDERPEHVRRLEEYRQAGRWKVLGKDKHENDIASKDYGVISSSKKGGTKKFSNQIRHRQDSDSDPSPPRRNRHDSDSNSSPPRKRRHNSDSDASPPRKKKDNDRSDSTQHKNPHSRDKPNLSSYRVGADQVHRVSSDQTDVRRKRHDSNSDEPPPRKQRHDSDSDQSLTRKQRHDNTSDQSPPRKQRHDSDSDHSPPRKQNSADFKPIDAKNKKRDSDQSPPRRSRKDGDSDQSPARRRKVGDWDQSPPRRRNESDSDQSPPRRRKKGDSDLSPPRRKGNSESKGAAKPDKTLSGAKAGLSSAAEMKREAEKLKKREEEMFAKIGKDALGKDAKTVFRDKSGKRRDLEAERKEEEAEARKQAELDKKYKEWGQGLKQKEMKEQTMHDYVHEASKPLARYKDDEDLDRIMREMEREGDPMAVFMKKKQPKKDNTANEKPRYRGPLPPPNRFGIMPGYRWDGVDRSNGFEKKIFAKMAEKKAVKEHAYKWSTEDM